ncbi:MAG: CatA-like O-acetyltransferase [Thermoanaerobaculia bacterium]
MKSGEIDIERWSRRDHYRFFRAFERPHFSVCAEVDVTRAWESSRAGGKGAFTIAMLWALLRAVNEVEAFRLRFRADGSLWLHDRVGLGPTVLRDDGTFGFARLPYAEDRAAFVDHAAIELARARGETGLRSDDPSQDDVVFQSTLPWIRFTSFTNAIPHRDDSIPRIVFGKFVREGEKVTMPVAVEVHHAVVDGRDVGECFELWAELSSSG